MLTFRDRYAITISVLQKEVFDLWGATWYEASVICCEIFSQLIDSLILSKASNLTNSVNTDLTHCVLLHLVCNCTVLSRGNFCLNLTHFWVETFSFYCITWTNQITVSKERIKAPKLLFLRFSYNAFKNVLRLGWLMIFLLHATPILFQLILQKLKWIFNCVTKLHQQLSAAVSNAFEKAIEPFDHMAFVTLMMVREASVY